MQRYLINQSQINNNFVEMTKTDSYHMIKVMRMKINDQVELCANKKAYLAKISEIRNDLVYLTIIKEIEEDKELPVHVSIAQGTVNRNKMEEVIEHLAMLGTSSYVFFPMERSIIKIDESQISKKMPRLLTISKEACEVAHRSDLMTVAYLKNFKEFLDYAKNFDVCLYAYEKTDFSNRNFKKVLKDIKNKKLLILIGPEGGISEKEVSLLNDNNFLPITLGPRILRTELAPSYCLAAISYELELEE